MGQRCSSPAPHHTQATPTATVNSCLAQRHRLWPWWDHGDYAHVVAVLDAPSEVRADIERRVTGELGATVRSWSRVAGGTQNRLFRLQTLEDASLLAKL
jgi:hypothetical protein